MSELAERAKEVSDKIAAYDAEDSWTVEQFEKFQYELIEQALLAERRLAMEEAAKIAAAMAEPCIDPATCSDASHRKARKLANQLRAAAEKEVGK